MPDLVWALIFVIAVGLGPFAGTLAIAIDTAGFCGRFFAEAMEDVDKGPAEALRAQGVRRIDTIFCAIIPAARRPSSPPRSSPSRSRRARR